MTRPLAPGPVALAALAVVLALALAACAEPPHAAPILESTTSAAVVEGADDPRTVAPDALTTPAAGSPTPLVVVTVFTDFQCPACPPAEAFMELLRQFWPDDVQVQYRHLPLDMHPLARSAGCAAAAAHRQGGYACMARALYRTQATWSSGTADALRAHVQELAGECGLDATRLVADMDDRRVIARVVEDKQLANELGVRATPLVLVNGVRATLSPKDGVRPATLLKALVRRELRDAQAQLALGMTRAEIPRARLFGNLGNDALVDRLLE